MAVLLPRLHLSHPENLMSKKTPKRPAPETIRQARTWENVKNQALRFGLCHGCASQSAWGHQLGFNEVTHPPCDECAPLVATLPVPRPNGWRSIGGSAGRVWKTASDDGPAPVAGKPVTVSDEPSSAGS